MQLWGDGFDHYGVRANADVFYTHHNYGINTDHPRTGSWNAILNHGGDQWFARPIVSSRTVIMGAAIYTPAVMVGGQQGIFISKDIDFATAVAVYITPQNTVRVCRGNTILAETAPGVYTPGTYNYFQTKVFNDDTNGTIEVRLGNNPVPIILLANQALHSVGFNNVGFVGNMADNANIDTDMYIDDFYINDTTGAYNNDFCGPVRCRTRFTSANGGSQDFVPFNAPAFSELNVVPFNGAAHHISGANVNDTSNFVVDAVPTNTAFAASQIVFVVASKSDGGTCTVLPQINSNAVVANGTPINPDVTYGMYLGGIFEFDPNTNAAWLLPGIQATLPQVKRTA